MLKKIQAILKVHFKVAVSIFTVSLLLLSIVGFLTPKVYQAHTSIYIQKKIPTVDEQVVSKSVFSEADTTDHAKIIQSNVVLGRVSQKLQKRFPKRGTVTQGQIASRLQVLGSKNTRVIELSYKDNDPQFVKDVLTETLVEYENTLRQMERDTKAKSLEMVKQRLAVAERERLQVESQIQAFQSENGTTDFETKNEEIMKLSISYSDKISELTAKLISSEREMAHLNQILGMSSDDIKKLARIKEDAKISAWQLELGREQAELSEMQSVYTDNYPSVAEKKRTIEHLENLIRHRVQEISGLSVAKEGMPYSDIDNALGQKFLEQSVQYLGLLGEKEYYEELLEQFPEHFTEIASEGHTLAELKYKASVLRDEIRKLAMRLSDESLQSEMLDTVGSFTVITAPILPKPNDYVFPLKPKAILAYGLFASVLLSLFSVGLVEYVNPRIIDLGSIPVLAELKDAGKRINENELSNVYQNMALLVNKMQLKTVTMLHLCDSNEETRCPYSPGVFAKQLVAMFAKRGVKTLLVECSGNCDESLDDAVFEKIGDCIDHTLYRDKANQNMHILSPNNACAKFFDPYTLKAVPDFESYDLVLVNASLFSNEMADSLLCEVSDATVFGISQSKTASQTLRNFQQMARERQVKLLGSIIFP